ncbi:permease prefix domain 1-containing protein [Hungatella hathewayi]|uniref:permease prefix domain 1-containing protein n=1 Tax=Hungatella hathewayi TaxID=154046 RepID=UPI001D20CDE8|nr:permease prefix domain 1-containing protein [Hungatella hathewayi]MBS6758133.1 FtsW/RodA/SpoVE family cell cycle protein [Hungatella hathewayi]
MELSEYLDTVSEQIRCKRARTMVREELKNHVQEQAEAYEADGMTAPEAMREAVRQMGDPIETGTALNRIHRPQLEWKFLILVLLLSALGLALQYMTCYTGLFGGFSSDLADYFWKRQCFFTVAGLGVLAAVYIVDYTILGRYPLLLWFGYFAVIFIIANTHTVIMGKVRIYNYLTLFLPLYAGVLYRFRSKGYGAVAVCYLLSFMPFFVGLKTILVHGSLELAGGCFLLLLIAVCKGIFHVRKTRTIAALIALPLITSLLLYWKGADLGLLHHYQLARLQYVFSPDMLDYNSNGGIIPYLWGSVSGFRMFGSSAAPVPKAMKSLNCDYVVFFVFAKYGIAAGTAMLSILAITAVKAFSISRRQKNRLGFLVGTACSVVLTIQMMVYVAANFGVPLVEPMTIPFLSYGGQSTLVNYILLGLILSVHRNKDIVSERHGTRGKWKIRLERIES